MTANPEQANGDAEGQGNKRNRVEDDSPDSFHDTSSRFLLSGIGPVELRILLDLPPGILPACGGAIETSRDALRKRSG